MLPGFRALMGKKRPPEGFVILSLCSSCSLIFIWGPGIWQRKSFFQKESPPLEPNEILFWGTNHRDLRGGRRSPEASSGDCSSAPQGSSKQCWSLQLNSQGARTAQQAAASPDQGLLPPCQVPRTHEQLEGSTFLCTIPSAEDHWPALLFRSGLRGGISPGAEHGCRWHAVLGDCHHWDTNTRCLPWGRRWELRMQTSNIMFFFFPQERGGSALRGEQMGTGRTLPPTHPPTHTHTWLLHFPRS